MATFTALRFETPSTAEDGPIKIGKDYNPQPNKDKLNNTRLV